MKKGNDVRPGGSGPLLEGRELDYRYSRTSEAKWAVRKTSLRLRRGDFAALIGPNGCGKSTLLRLLAGVLEPEGGRVALDGRDLGTFDRRCLARRIAYVPQAQATAFPFSVLEVVLTGRSPYTARFRFENPRDHEIALEALDTLGVADLAERPITELSAGERQLVAVARALAQAAECLLLDEPSASLDLKHRAWLIATLSRLRDGGMTVLMVTHDLDRIDPDFDRLYMMAGGEIAFEGPPSQILTEDRLAHVYDDPCVKTHHAGKRTFVWSEADR